MGNIQSATMRIYSAGARTVTHQSGNKTVMTAGSVADLPELYADTLDLGSNQVVHLARSGPTAARPTAASAHPPVPGTISGVFIDTSLNKAIFYISPGLWVDYSGTTV